MVGMVEVAATRTLSDGTLLDDKYRVDRLLAVGGMGAVYAGTHIRLRKRVAIKLLNPQMSSASMIERFHREAITASQIGHEGIAQVTDLGTTSDGEPFLVMELLEGESLATRLKASGALPIEDACELGCAILSPLSAAHRAGIVHRDLKPDNVFLVRQSRGEMVKLLDFGISRTVDRDGEFRLTTTGLVLGTPYYMSPEQARGDNAVTPAADLYAFGVMLYEMLIGVVPIQADNYNQLMYRVMVGEYIRPRERRPELPVELEDVLVHALALAPADRPASALALEQALLPFCRPAFREHASMTSSPSLSLTPLPSLRIGAGAGGSDRTMLADSAALHDARNALTRPDASHVRAARARRGKLVAAVAGVVVVGLAGLTAALLRHSEPAPAPSPAATSLTAPSVAALPTPGAAPATGSAAPATGTPATITLRFAVDPLGAAIVIDGQPVNGSEIVVPRDAADHALRITAPGHMPHDETLRFDESQRVTVQLRPNPAPGRGKPRPDSATPAERARKERGDRGDRGDRIESQSPYD